MTENKEEKYGSDIARETMTGDLRDCLLDFMKHEKNPLPWNMRTEEQQADVIEKVTRAVTVAVERAVNIIASDGRSVIEGTLEKVTFKDGIKAEVSIDKHTTLRHALTDAQGEIVLMVVASSSAYDGERKPAIPEPNQTSLLDDDNRDVYDDAA